VLTTNRAGFKIGVLPSDNILWAIGMIAYQWSALENDLDVWLGVAGITPPSRAAGQRASFKERARLFRQTVEERAAEPARSQLLAIIDRTTGMQAERDKIIHRNWGAPDGERLNDIRNFQFGGKKGIDDWRITYAKLREIALKIDELRADLYQLVFRYGKRADAEGFLQSNAWRRICGEPEPGR
jgi:hypothetical protein